MLHTRKVLMVLRTNAVAEPSQQSLEERAAIAVARPEHAHLRSKAVQLCLSEQAGENLRK